MKLLQFQKSWDIALGPFKQIPMNLFIMYMAGNSISIFPIMMVGMMFLRPVKALLAVKSSKLLCYLPTVQLLRQERQKVIIDAPCMAFQPALTEHSGYT